MNARIEQEQIDSDCAKQIAAIEHWEIGYDTEQHNALRTALREAQSAALSTAIFSPAAISPVTAAIAGSYPAFKPD